LLDEIPPDQMPAWIERLRAMSVAEAVAYVRQVHDEARAAAARDTAAAPIATPPSDTSTAAPAKPAATSTAPSASDDRRADYRSALPRAERRAHAAPGSAGRPSPATANTNGTPRQDSRAHAHLAAIDQALTLEERAALRKHLAGLSSSDRAGSIATLLVLPLAEAVATIRAQLAGDSADTQTSAVTGAVSAASVEPPRHERLATLTAAAAHHEQPANPTVAASAASAEPAATARGEHLANSPQPTARRASRTDPTGLPGATMPLAVVSDPAPMHDAAELADRATTPATTSPEALTYTTGSAGTATAAADPSLPDPAATASNERIGASPHATDGSLRAPMVGIDSAFASDERVLAPGKRVLADTMVAGLSSDAREAWPDNLSSVPTADSVAMGHGALHELITAVPRDALVFGTLSRSPANALDVEALSDDDQELANDQEPDDHELHDDDQELDADQEPGDDHELDDDQEPNDDDQQLDPATATSGALPTLDEASLAHFKAIEDALTFGERMRAHELVAQRPVSELRRWYAELREISVPDAVDQIRAELAHSGRSALKGDVL
jgi:hypothetical protein